MKSFRVETFSICKRQFRAAFLLSKEQISRKTTDFQANQPFSFPERTNKTHKKEKQQQLITTENMDQSVIYN